MVVEQPRKISAVRFLITEAGASEALAEGVARVVTSSSLPPPITEGR